jgi:hypothetical protein
LKLSSLAVAAALLSVAAVPQAASATTNFALSSNGASFVSGSSIIAQGTFGLTMNFAVMQANLLTDTPSASISNGDTRYIFDSPDPDATIEIDLGQLRNITTIGTIATIPSFGDRFLQGPFSAEVSTDGVTFTPFGSPVTINFSTTNPVSIVAPAQSVEFIRYHFGPSPAYFGAGGGGIGVSQVLAIGSGVPEPASWALMICGLGLAGASLRRRRALGGASATA